MKKFLILSLIVCVSGISSVNAASVGGKQPEQGKLAVGFEYNQIIEKDIESDPVIDDLGITNSSQYLTKIEYGLLGSDLFNWSVFTKLGIADMEGKAEDTKFPSDGECAWGLGSKLTYKLEACEVGVEAQYFSINGLSTSENFDPGDNLDEEWKEWQVSLFVAKDLEFANFSLMPYLGVRYSDLQADMEFYDAGLATTENYDVTADKNIGVFVGADIEITKNISVNVEGRFIDEKAVTAGLSYRF